jgi:hypothetical protein
MPEKRKYADRAQQNIKAVAKRRKKVREMAIEKLGGKCLACGYNKCQNALEFHHVDETKKDFGISSKGYTRSWKAIEAEIDKCLLLCANCHREAHAGVCSFPSKDGLENKENCGKPSLVND